MHPIAANRRLPLLAPTLLVLGLLSGGCAAVTSPVADAIPVRLVPPELLKAPRGCQETISLNLLGQVQPDAYRLAAEDVLGVYVEGFLGDKTLPLPVHVTTQIRPREQAQLAPSLGFPVAVQGDGTVTLPLVGAVRVAGLTLAEATATIRKVYIDRQLLKADVDRVLVSLMYPRQHRILVMRQEAAGLIVGPEGVTSGSKRGTGHEVDLPAYENDVLHALALTGGLPGLDACDTIIIQRNAFADEAGRTALKKALEQGPGGASAKGLHRVAQTIRIPLRLPPGAPLPIRPEDVVLQTGDVVFVEARDDEIFYTAGLLPPAAHVLPRDHDLDVLEAVARSRGALLNGAFAVSNLSGNLIEPGIGNPSPSQLVVVRKTPNGGQVAIHVDIDCAFRDPRERILIQAGDLLVLQEAPEQALARYFSQTFLNFNLLWNVVRSKYAVGILDVSGPDRLPFRLGQATFVP
jgi:protein involved in polysaccharide export with SLBB domain